MTKQIAPRTSRESRAYFNQPARAIDVTRADGTVAPLVTDQAVMDRALAVLGFQPDDESVEAVRAQTWVAAAFDGDITWLESAAPDAIRQLYELYRRIR